MVSVEIVISAFSQWTQRNPDWLAIQMMDE
jgi:hypothetical protein